MSRCLDPPELKAYLVKCIGWDAPLLDALVHNAPDGWFRLTVYASELRAKLTPLFRDWVPSDCSVALSGGYGLAKIHLPGVISILYTATAFTRETYSFCVEREVRYLGESQKSFFRIDDKSLPQDWIAEFKNDVIAHYAIEKTLTLIDPAKRYLPTHIIGDHVLRLELKPDDDDTGPSLRVTSRFNGRWEELVIALTDRRKFSFKIFTFPGGSGRWGFQKFSHRGDMDASLEPPDSTGLEPLLLHDSIANEFERLSSSSQLYLMLFAYDTLSGAYSTRFLSGEKYVSF